MRTTILNLILLTSVAGGAYAQRDKLDVALGAAQHKEEVQGDLKGAIAAYKKVIAEAGANRVVAAKAHLRLGLCYEKLGAADASRVYRELLARFADQKEIAGQAQARLDALAGGVGAARTMSVRLLWDHALNSKGTISKDGRWMSFIDWTSGGDVAIRDLVNGTNRRVNDAGDWPRKKVTVEETVLSPDGKHIAYQWADSRTKFVYEVRVVDVDGKNERTLHRPVDGFASPLAWLPDGKRIAVFEQFQVNGKWQQGRLLFMNVADGKFVSRMQGWVNGIAFSPDGRWFSYANEDRVFVGSTEGSEAPVALPGQSAREKVMAWTPEGRHVLILSERGGSPSFWLLPVADGKSSGEAVLVKSGLTGGVRGNGFTPLGGFVFGERERRNRVVMAGLNGVKLTGAPVGVNTQRVESSGGEWSPDGKRFLYWAQLRQRLTIRETATGVETEVTPQLKIIGNFATWTPGGKEILVFGGGQDGRTGFYLMDPRSGETRLVAESGVHPNFGRAAFSADGKTLYFTGPNHVSLAVKDLTTGAERHLVQGNAEIIRKVRLSPDGKTVSLSMDYEIRLLDAATGKLTRTIRGKQEGDLFRDHSWLADGNGLIALWRRMGDSTASLARIPLDGGEWESAALGMFGQSFHVSPDGKQVAIQQEIDRTQIWVMENFLPGTARAAR
ncbi:MAG: PD40 domain-containing protein [Acidobacteria bacterium]|nr:PD40 domain-containing protein [Acidobacteriota bacterium]